MITKFLLLFSVLAACAGVHHAAAQETRFFRISGPAATKILALQTDGSLVWSNALAGTNYTVQVATSLVGGTNWVDYVQLPVTTGVNTNRVIDLNPPSGMALIPAGSFTMGDTFNEGYSSELPLHSVYVSAFYMDKYDVTKTLWDSVYQWATNHGYSFDNLGSWTGGVNYSKGANHPVHLINWYDCVKWCNARSEMEVRTPAYYTSAAQTTVYRTGQVNVDNNSAKWNAGYRLPTEAEWEKAARGGTSGQRFPWGNTISWSQANYESYWPGGTLYYPYDLAPTNGWHPTFATGIYTYTSPVGYFAPNRYGLYDMAGNVWQWCWDWNGSYGSASQTDPRGPASGSYRDLRGGSWASYAFLARCAFRTYNYPDERGYNIGFRCVLAVGQ
jgi:formylglycine-generating enzyme required for sulfatase activity